MFGFSFLIELDEAIEKVTKVSERIDIADDKLKNTTESVENYDDFFIDS